MATFTINSSHGTITADSKTGKVVSIDLTCNCKPNEQCINTIERFDVDEFKKTYKMKRMLSDVDILDLGYWIGEKYEEPVQDWRDEFRKEEK